MTKEDFEKLGPGDIVEHKCKSMTYTVVANYGNHVFIVKANEITNPDEWDIVAKAKLKLL